MSVIKTNEEEYTDKHRTTDMKYLALYILIVFYMFVAISIVCNKFFVVALETKSSEIFMNLTMLFPEQ